MTSDSTDREGMFTNPVVLDSRDPVHGDVFSVTTCTWCGCLVADTEAHQQMHATMVTRGFRAPLEEEHR